MPLSDIKATIKELYLNNTQEELLQALCRRIEHRKGEFDSAIVILTHSIEHRKNVELGFKTSFGGHMRAFAGAQLYFELFSKGLKPVIIVSGGKMRSDQPSLSEVMKSELCRKYEIPEESIISEEYSKDTVQNSRFSSRLLETLGFDNENNNVHLVTEGFHLQRAEYLFNKYFGDNIKANGAEKILKDIIVDRLKYSKSLREILQKILVAHINSDSNNIALENEAMYRLILQKFPFGLGEELMLFVAYLSRYSSDSEEP